jgi:hypothetical protein
MKAVIFNFLLVSYFTFLSMKRLPPVPRFLLIRHFLATASVAMLSGQEVYRLLFGVLHLQLAQASFYAPLGFAPAWLACSLRVLSMILGVVVWNASISLAVRKSKGRMMFLRVWPFLLTIWLIYYVIDLQSRGLQIVWVIFGFWLIGGIGALTYWHFRSSSSDLLFLKAKQPDS